MLKGSLVRDVTQNECPWLKVACLKGATVYRYEDYTYGVISPQGVAVSLVPDQTPFFELPSDAIVWE